MSPMAEQRHILKAKGSESFAEEQQQPCWQYNFQLLQLVTSQF